MAVALTACTTHDEAVQEAIDPHPVQIAAPVTRAVAPGATYYEGTSLALTYIYPSAPYDIATGTSSEKFTRFGVKWGPVEGTSNPPEWEQTGDTSNPMLWKSLEARVNMYAYAPFIEAAPGTTLNYRNIPFSIQRDQSTEAKVTANDLVGWQTQNYYPTPGQEKITIEFSHMLSELTVTLISGPGNILTAEELANAEVTVQGLLSSVTFSIEDFVAHTVEDYDVSNLTDIVPCQGESGSYRCVFPPQAIAANTQFIVVRAGGNNYTYQPVGALVFEPDTAYRLTLEVGDTRLNPVSIVATPWGSPHVMTEDELELK